MPPPPPQCPSAGAQMKIHCEFDIWNSTEFPLFILYAKGGWRKGERQRGEGKAGGVNWVGSVPEDPSSPQVLWHFQGWHPLVLFPHLSGEQLPGHLQGCLLIFMLLGLAESLLFRWTSLVWCYGLSCGTHTCCAGALPQSYTSSSSLVCVHVVYICVHVHL